MKNDQKNSDKTQDTADEMFKAITRSNSCHGGRPSNAFENSFTSA